MPGEVAFNINTQASVALIRKLEDVHRAALPNAIRGTLNGAAFDVKQRTLELSATNNFIRRVPSFFKRFSGVEKATGFDVRAMRATVGMTANGVEKAQTAISHMFEQEHGGSIGDGLQYVAAARVGRSASRLVSKSRYAVKQNIVRGKFKNKGTTKSRMVAAAYVSLRENKQIRTKIGSRTYYSMVTSIRSLTGKKNIGKLKIKSKLLSVSRDGHPARIKATNFSREAAYLTVPKMEGIFISEGERQIKKYWK